MNEQIETAEQILTIEPKNKLFYYAIGMSIVDKKQYNGWDGALEGTKHDPTNLENAIEKYYNINNKFSQIEKLIITDAACTDENVLKNIAYLSEKAIVGDTVVILYTGHGGQLWDSNGDEADDFDETWVLYNRQLPDDYIFLALAQFKKGVKVILLSDSCHSGTVYRNAENIATSERRSTKVIPHSVDVNLTQTDNSVVLKKLASQHLNTIQIGKLKMDKSINISCDLFFISGCKDDETSGDLPTGGIFTTAFISILDRYEGNISFQDMILELQKTTKGQTPQLSVESPQIRTFLKARALSKIKKQTIF